MTQFICHIFEGNVLALGTSLNYLLCITDPSFMILKLKDLSAKEGRGKRRNFYVMLL